MRRLLIFLTLVAALLTGVVTHASAADQPIAGQATLVGGRPLPQWGVLPLLTEGGFSGLYPVLGVPGEFWTLSDRGPNGDTFTVGAAAGTPTVYIEYGTGRPAAPCKFLFLGCD